MVRDGGRGGDELVLVFGGWSKVTTTLGTTRGGTAFSVRDVFHNDLHAFNTRTRAWRTVLAGGDLPAPRCQAALFPVPAGDDTCAELMLFGAVWDRGLAGGKAYR